MNEEIKKKIIEEKTKKKEIAVAEIEKVITTIEEKNHSNKWERHYLSSAIAALHSGLYSLAQSNALLVYTEEAERISDDKLSSEFDSLEITEFRKAFEAMKAKEVIPHPYFLP